MCFEKKIGSECGKLPNSVSLSTPTQPDDICDQRLITSECYVFEYKGESHDLIAKSPYEGRRSGVKKDADRQKAAVILLSGQGRRGAAVELN
jgi:hypothetical protein